MRLNIHKKAEAWKFSPKQIIESFEFKNSNEGLVHNYSDQKIAIGPSEQSLQTLSLKDLEEQNFVKLTQKETTRFFEDKNTKRAQLDRGLEPLFESQQTLSIEFLKSPPSNVWINPYTLNFNLEITLSESVTLNVLFFEPEAAKVTNPIHYTCSFNLKESSNLEAGFNHSSIQNSFTSINISMEENANADMYTLLSGDADYKRFELNIFKQGKNAHCSLNGLSSSKASASFDYHSNVFHLNNDQETNQNFKTICQDKSKSIFTGRVHLTEKASGAQVDQINNNLLLGTKSAVDTQPELNIYQDNVKASHGATTSTLDESHLFYFSSRGFPLEQSRRLLLEAFCKSTCDNLNNSGIKQHFIDAISKELTSVQ